MSGLRHALIACAVYAVLDVVAAWLCRDTALWGPEAAERRYRVASPVYDHDLARSLDVTGRWGGIRYPLRTNSLGFRDARVRDIPLRGGSPRVLFIGDSFTEGIGVAYEWTYVGLLDRRLGARGMEVLNAAAASYSPTIYYRKLKYLLEEAGLGLDYVVVAVDLSDVPDETFYDLDSTGKVVTHAPPGARLRQFLKEHSLAFHVADVVKDTFWSRLTDPEHWALGMSDTRADWTVDAEAYESYGRWALDRAGSRMSALLELLRAHEVGMALVVYPWPTQIVRGDSASLQVRFWEAWAGERQVPFFDLFPPFYGGPAERVVRANFIAHDVHWNERGHRLIAETLLAAGLADTIRQYLTGAAGH